MPGERRGRGPRTASARHRFCKLFAHVRGRFIVAHGHVGVHEHDARILDFFGRIGGFDQFQSSFESCDDASVVGFAKPGDFVGIVGQLRVLDCIVQFCHFEKGEKMAILEGRQLRRISVGRLADRDGENHSHPFSRSPVAEIVFEFGQRPQLTLGLLEFDGGVRRDADWPAFLVELDAVRNAVRLSLEDIGHRIANAASFRRVQERMIPFSPILQLRQLLRWTRSPLLADHEDAKIIGDPLGVFGMRSLLSLNCVELFAGFAIVVVFKIAATKPGSSEPAQRLLDISLHESVEYFAGVGQDFGPLFDVVIGGAVFGGKRLAIK